MSSATQTSRPGPLVLVGGGEFSPGCDFDGDLIKEAGSSITLLSTAAAYENPDLVAKNATEWFSKFGARVNPLSIFSRHDAEDEELCRPLVESQFIYLSGGSALHLKSVLKGSRAFGYIEEAWRRGAMVVGSSAGAMVLSDPMVDPRGGAFTLGLGLVEGMSVVPHYESYSEGKAHRTVEFAPKDVALVGLDEATAIYRDSGGNWSKLGAGRVFVYQNGHLADLNVLP